MDFDMEELPEDESGVGEITFEADDDALPGVVVLLVASPGAEPELAQAIGDALSDFVRATSMYSVIDGQELRASLFAPGEAAAMDCVANAVCLSGYGKDLDIQSIIMGVLYRGDTGWKINVDKIDVERAEVQAYAVHDDGRLASRGQADIERIASKMGNKLLGLGRPSGDDDDAPRTKLVPMRGPLQTKLAWGTAGLAALAFGTAVVFGIGARSIEADLTDKDLPMTRVEGQENVTEGKRKGVTANIFYGVAIAAAAGSAALFMIKPLQEVPMEPLKATPGFGDDLEDDGGATLVPMILPDAFGVSAAWSLP